MGLPGVAGAGLWMEEVGLLPPGRSVDICRESETDPGVPLLRLYPLETGSFELCVCPLSRLKLRTISSRGP